MGLLFFLFAAAKAQNRTIFVDIANGSNTTGDGTAGSPYQTLSFAHSQSSDGDTLELAAGTYDLTASNGISISRNNLTIRSAPGTMAHITRDLGLNNNIFKYYSATTGGRLERLEITGGYYGIHLSSNWTDISDEGDPTPGVEDMVEASTGVQVVDCYIHHTGRDAIKSSAGCDDLLVKRCHIAFTGEFDDTNCDGIDIVNADRVKVQECYIHDIPTRGAYCKGGSTDVVFENNLVMNTNGGLFAGFFSDQNLFNSTNTNFYESINCVIRNNILINTGYVGIETQQSIGLKVYNNTIAGATRGIRFSSNTEIPVQRGSEDVEIKNNIFLNTGNVQQIQDIGTLGTPLAELDIDNNIFYRSGGGYTFNLNGATHTQAEWLAAGKDANSFFDTDPLLDEAYHLTETSAARGAGASLGIFNMLDYDGDSRGPGFDIGADQYGPATALEVPPSGIGTGLVLPVGLPALTYLLVAPAEATVYVGNTQQFTAGAYDQFGIPFTADISWETNAGASGAVNDNGLFSAAAEGGPFSITAQSGDVTGSATVTVAAADEEAPTVPAGLASSYTSHNVISVEWSASADNVAVTEYKVYRDGEMVGTTANTSYHDAGLSATTTYTYAVSAVDGEGNESAQSVAVEVTTSSPSGTWEDNIPLTRMRIFYNDERWAQVEAWYAENPFEPSAATNPIYSSFDPIGNALKYHLTGETQYADIAIEGIRNASVAIFDQIGGHCDQCRWYGEQVAVTYDWLYDYMSEEDRDFIYANIDPAFDYFLDFYWGAAQEQFVENNYFWGYFRNALLWGVANYYEHPERAKYFIDRAMIERWEEIAVPYYTTVSPFGLPSEGVSYGPAMLYYQLTAYNTLRIYGRDVNDEVDYYRNAAWTLMYQVLPKETYDSPLDDDPDVNWFPYGDADGYVHASNPARVGSLGDFMTDALTTWDGTLLEEYVRTWLHTTGNINTAHRIFHSIDNGGAMRPLSELPVDYYTPGVSNSVYTKSSWDPSATIVNLQLSVAPSVGHEHYEHGSWQIWRDGVWLSREAPGRGVGSGYQVTGYAGVGTIDVEYSIAHNTLLYNGSGTSGTHESVDPHPYSTLLRVESEPDYMYSVVDLSNNYRMEAEAHTEREFVYVKPLESLVIFDRMASSSAGTTKTFLAHFQGAPDLNGSTYTHVNRDQLVNLTTLLPADPVRRVIDENRHEDDNSHRVEIETSGALQSYFLHVVQARSADGDADLTFELTETETQYRLTLSHPSKGNAVLVFNKGVTNSGGEFAYSQLEVPSATTPFAQGVEEIIATNDGIIWADEAFAPGELPGFNPNPDAVLTTVTVSPAEVTLPFNGSRQLLATAYDEEGNVMPAAFTWESTGVGSVSSSGLFSAGSSEGTATVTATVSGVSGSATIAVVDPTPVLTSIQVTPENHSLVEGSQQQFTASPLDQFGEPFEAAVEWATDAGTSGSITGEGLFSAVVPGGPFTITATSGDVSGATSVTITETPVATTIEINPTAAYVQVGQSVTFEASVLDQFGDEIEADALVFSTDAGESGTIDASSGTFEGLGVGGPFTITATMGALEGTASVTVLAPGSGAPLSPAVAGIDEVFPFPGSVNVTATELKIIFSGNFSTEFETEDYFYISRVDDGEVIATFVVNPDLNVLPYYSTNEMIIDVTGLLESATEYEVTSNATINVNFPGFKCDPIPAGVWRFTTGDTQAPEAPGGVQSSDVTQSEVTLSWTASSDDVAVVEYKVYRDDVQITTVEQNEYTDTGLAASTTYSYTVSAIDAAGNESALSAVLEVATAAAPDTEAPSVPAELSASEVTATGVKLTWAQPADNVGVTGYKIYRHGLEIGSVETATFTDTGLSAATTYSYKVTALDAAGNESAQSSALEVTTAATTDTEAPSIPAGLAASNVSASSAELSWSSSTDNVGVTGYKVFRDGVEVATVNQTNHKAEGLAAATTYSFTVSAVDAAGNASAQSAAATVTTLANTDTEAPAVVTGLAVSDVTASGLTLTWLASSDNVGTTLYHISRGGAEVATVSGTAFTDSGLTDATTYTYTVIAEDAAGNRSALSAALSAITLDGTAPSIPAGLVAANVSPEGVSLSWEAAADNVGVVAYKVYRDGVALSAVETTVFQDSDLLPAETYSYAVSALDAAGNESGKSDPVAVVALPLLSGTELSTVSSTVVFPNPFSDHLTVDVGSNKISHLIMLHISGQILFEKRFTEETTGRIFLELPDTRVPRGIYLLKIVGETGAVRVFRVIKSPVSR